MTRSPVTACLLGLAAVFVVAHFWGSTLVTPGPYRSFPWAHLGGVLVLGGLAMAVFVRGRGHVRGVRRFVAAVGSLAAVAAALLLWAFVFLGSRLPPPPTPSVTALPALELLDEEGNVVRLRPPLGGPVVVAFYRGAFDTWARALLSDLERARPAIERAGGRVYAISIDSEAEARGLAHKLRLGYRLLSDGDLAAARSFGVAEEGTAHPAIFVARPDGAIVWTHVLRSLRDLPGPDELVRRATATP